MAVCAVVKSVYICVLFYFSLARMSVDFFLFFLSVVQFICFLTIFIHSDRDVKVGGAAGAGDGTVLLWSGCSRADEEKMFNRSANDAQARLAGVASFGGVDVRFNCPV